RRADPRGARASRERPARASWLSASRAASRQASRRATSAERAEALVAPIPLFLPGVSVVVVAVGLPEPRLVAVEELEPSNPLRTLPEVEVRDEHPGRAAVDRLEGLAVVLVRNPCLTVGDIDQREVRRVAAIAERQHEVGGGIDVLEQGVDRHAAPWSAEL